MAAKKSTQPARPLPDREVIEERLEAAIDEIFNAKNIIGTAMAAFNSDAPLEDTDIPGALSIAYRMLNHLGGDTLCAVRLLAPAEAQEVAHG